MSLVQIEEGPAQSLTSARQLLHRTGVCLIHTGSREEVAYLTARAATLPAPTQLLLELRWAPGAPGVRAAVRSERPELAPLVFAALRGVLGG